MTKLRVVFVIDGKSKEGFLWNGGVKSLTALFGALSEKREPPYDITELKGRVQFFHPFFMAWSLRDDLETLKNLGVVELRNQWRHLLVLPRFKEVSIKTNDVGRSVVKITKK